MAIEGAVNNPGTVLQGTPEGRRRAGALMGETTRYLLVYEEGSMGDVTEAEVQRQSSGGAIAWPCAKEDLLALRRLGSRGLALTPVCLPL